MTSFGFSFFKSHICKQKDSAPFNKMSKLLFLSRFFFVLNFVLSFLGFIPNGPLQRLCVHRVKKKKIQYCSFLILLMQWLS